jgi:sugar lactone lactonase YvrE
VWSGKLLLAVCVALSAFAQQNGKLADLASQVSALNATLAGETPASSPIELDARLTRRAALLAELLKTDPGQAIDLALPAQVRQRLRSRAPVGAIEVDGEWQGEIQEVVYDDFAHHRSRMTWYLRTPLEKVALFFPGKPSAKPGSVAHVVGLRFPAGIAALTMKLVGNPGTPSTPSSCSTIGPQNILVILVTTPAYPSFPTGEDASYFQTWFFGPSTGIATTDSLDAFWQQNSYGLTSATGQVIGPISVNTDPPGCSQPDTSAAPSGDFTQEVLNAADSLVDLTHFTRIVFVFPALCSYGGTSSVGCGSLQSPGKGSFTASESLLPVPPDEELYASFWLNIIAHELGHALGLNHASIEDYGPVTLGALDDPGPEFANGAPVLPYPADIPIEYGDLFSVMGLTKSYGQYVAEHKSLILGWLKPGNYVEVTSSGTFNLQPFESTADPRALRVLRDAATGAWLWVEYRQPLGEFDSYFPLAIEGTDIFKGALIHYENPDLDSPFHSYLLNFSPISYPNYFTSPVLLPGQSWSDPHTPLTLRVNSAGSSGLSMTVSYDRPCAAIRFSTTSFPASGGNGVITVTAPDSCAWSASIFAGWITLSGSTAGHGNGTISFTVAPNTGEANRNGFITVGRQSTAISQLGDGVSVLSASPASGSGSSGQFTFKIGDAEGYANTRSVTVIFEGSPECHIIVSPISQSLVLLNDSGAEALGPLSFATPGQTVSNGYCSVASTGSSIGGAGDILTMTLQLSFEAAFAGGHRIDVQAAGSSASSGVVSFGSWVVPPASANAGNVAVTIASSLLGSPFSVDGGTAVQAPATFYWNAGDRRTITWLTSMPGRSISTYTFLGWKDGGSNPRTITVPAAATTYSATVIVRGLSYVIQAIAGGMQPATSAPGLTQAVPSPSGVTVGALGDVYFSGGSANSVYRMDGAGVMTRVAGTGTRGYAGDGAAATNAELTNPQGVAADFRGNVYIADQLNHRIRRVAADGRITTIAGSGCCGGYIGDGGPATAAQLNSPSGVAVHGTDLYIADSANNVIRKIARDGTITTVAGNGTAGYSGDGGPATNASLNGPFAVVVDSSGNLYISDRNNHCIRRVSVDGTISTVAGICCAASFSGDNGPATSAQLNSPQAVAFGPSGQFYIADEGNHRVREVASDGTITTVAGNGSWGFSGDRGPALRAQLDVYSVASDSAGNLYITDDRNQRIRRVSPDGTIATVAGGALGDGGISPFAGLNQPAGVAKDSAGNVYIADTNNHRVRKITAGGVISTLAGTGIAGYSGDGGPASAAQLDFPEGVATDSAGNLYIADTLNMRIRKVALDGTISTVAGNGWGFSGDGGPATQAKLFNPWAVAFDSEGNFYIADSGSNRIRKVALDGTISTVAGGGVCCVLGDGGPATNATLSTPRGVAIDGAGNLFIADTYNFRIRKVGADGVITTVVGNTASRNFATVGDGGPAISAALSMPASVAVDTAGDIFIADTGNNRICAVTPDGTIRTVAGRGSFGDSGDGGSAVLAEFRSPQGLGLDSAGNLYVADTSSNAIRLLTPGSSPALTVSSRHSGSFTAGQIGTYTLVVSSAMSAAPTNGTISVTEILPPSLKLVSMAGTGWTCDGNTCMRSDSVNGDAFPPITVTVSTTGSPSQVTNQVTVSGGGAPMSGAEDLTVVNPAFRECRPAEMPPCR